MEQLTGSAVPQPVAPAFFGDQQLYGALCADVFPALLGDRPAGAPLRVWVAGCGTGEDVYSIVMSLLEAAPERNPPLLQIFATDVRDDALATAREGIYSVDAVRGVSPDRVSRFFNTVGRSHRIDKSTRELCVFAHHDLTRDPPYSRLDLIVCRAALADVAPELRGPVIATFHYALRPGGTLVLRPGEAVDAELFTLSDPAHGIHVRKATAGPQRFFFSPGGDGHAVVARAPPASRLDLAPAEADRMLLARFAPAALVIDDTLRILEFRGDTDPFLEHDPGDVTFELGHVVRKELRVDLRHAIAEARETGRPVRRDGLRLRGGGDVPSVSLEVIPILGRAAAAECLLVVFQSGVPAVPSELSRHTLGASAASDARELEIVRLDREVEKTAGELRALTIEHEGALDELNATNEEAQSNIEELQSVNEELLSAKEQIQSTNDVMATLNLELNDRNAQLATSNDEIRHALESATALVDTVQHPLLILDHELRVEQANASFYETFHTMADETLGRRLSELGGGCWDVPSVIAALTSVMSCDTAVEDLAVDADFPHIGARNMCLSARCLRPADAGRRRIVLAIEDRTDSKRIEQERLALFALEHDARRRAEAADRLKDEFVATVSHELRGPLSIISGWNNILQGAGPAPDQVIMAKAVAAIGRGVSTQGRLIADLLDHSRLTTGTLELQRGLVDLLGVAEAAAVAVRAAAEAKEITVEISGERGSTIVLGDPDRLQQVLWNLAFNAVKFTPRKGRVQIGVGRTGNQAQVTVTDSGRGIDPEFLPHVFARFRQADASSSRAQQGLGLGLTLVREIVELHGGEVRAESQGPDLGATFTVLLPVPALLSTAAAPAAPNGAPVASIPVDQRQQTLKGTSVLVVDDEADARAALVGLLEMHGASVRAAASAAEALDELQGWRPDVLVSDLGMPDVDGHAMIRSVRLLPKDAGGNVPAIAVTAYATGAHRRESLASGFQAQLEKPVEPSALVAEIARLARGSAPPAS